MIKKLVKYCFDSDYRFLINAFYGINKSIPDEEFLKKKYKILLKKNLNLENPKTCTEKLNWYKINYRNPLMTTLVDKFKVKEYVSQKIGKKYVIPVIAGPWKSFDEIDFEKLPKQFVLKCNHDSAGLVICEDKSTLDINAAKKKINKALKRNYYWFNREWAYKNVEPLIFAEEYFPTLGKKESVEYKICCSYGKAKIITVCTGIPHDLYEKRKNDHYDEKYQTIPFSAFYDNSEQPVPLPNEIDELIKITETLAEGLPHVRVDTYIVNGSIYFGEFTFYTWGGFPEITPRFMDKKLGELFPLNDVWK